jgi:hypothetical protein
MSGSGTQAASDTSDSEDDGSRNGLSTLLAAAIPAAYGVIIALLVALGIQGEVLTRLLRNEPIPMAIAFGLAIVGAALPLIGIAISGVVRATSTRDGRVAGTRVAAARTWGLWLNVAGATMLLAGVILALVAGIWTFSDREQPTLTITSSSVDDAESAEITFEASALSLSTEDKMLLRVIVLLDRTADVQQANEVCRNASSVAPPADGESPASVLFWGETGPNATGATANTATVRVAANRWTFVCALAALSDTRDYGQGSGDQRFVSTLVDVRNVPVSSTD